MMDVNGCIEQRRQQYESLLREAEERRFARESGFTETNMLRSVAAGLWTWLSQIVATDVSNSEPWLISQERHGE